MDEVISSYLTALDELNVLTSTSYQMAGGDYSARVNQIVDDVLSFLINAYALGIRNAGIMLDHELSVNVDKMQDAIFMVIEGKTFADRVADHVGGNDLGGLKNLVESEYHRVYNAAVYDGGMDYVDKHALCDEILTPSVRKYLIYDNSASIKGKGIDFNNRI